MVVAVYGAGIYGQIFKESLFEAGIKVNYFIDKFSKKSQVLGVPVVNINELKDKSQVEVYISVALNEKEDSYRSIKQDLLDVGFLTIYEFVDSIHKVPYILSRFPQYEILWMSKQIVKMVDTVAIKKLELLLCDQKSRELLKKIILFRQTFTAENYLVPDKQKEYFPNDIDVLQSINKLKFIDAGAYTGDTIRSALEACCLKGTKVEYIVSFEPDVKNIAKLSQEVKTQKKIFPETNYFIYT